jgi:ankyrin repeat protein
MLTSCESNFLNELVELLKDNKDFLNIERIVQKINQMDAGVINQIASQSTLLHLAIDRYFRCLVADRFFYSSAYLEKVEDATSELVELLISKGAEINKIDILGEAPLHKAAKAGSNKLVRKLIGAAQQQGLDVVSIKGGKFQDTALHYVSKGYMIYRKYYDYNPQYKYENVDLSKHMFEDTIAFLQKKYAETAHAILEHSGGDIINKKNNHGETALHVAVKDARDTRLVKLLLEAKADIKIVNNDSDTILHLAVGAEKNTYKLTKLLVKKGCSKLINSKNKTFQTPIHCLLHKKGVLKHRKLLKYLLEHEHTHVEAIDDELQTALHLAVMSAEDQIVHAIIKKGGNVNAINIDGRMPLHLAVEAYEDSRRCVLMLNDKPSENKRPAQLNINTLVVCRGNANLTVYWIESDEVQTRTLQEKDVLDIVAKLPPQNRKSFDKDLIQAIISRYGCPPRMSSSAEDKLLSLKKIIHLLVDNGAINVPGPNLKCCHRLTKDKDISSYIEETAKTDTSKEKSEYLKLKIISQNHAKLKNLVAVIVAESHNNGNLKQYVSLYLRYDTFYNSVIWKNYHNNPEMEIESDEQIKDEKETIDREEKCVRNDIQSLLTYHEELTVNAWEEKFKQLYSSYRLIHSKSKFLDLLDHLIQDTKDIPQKLHGFLFSQSYDSNLLKKELSNEFERQDTVNQLLEAYINTLSEVGRVLYTINTDLIKNSEDKEFINRLKEDIVNFDFNFTSDHDDPRIILRNREKRCNDLKKINQIYYRLIHASAISTLANDANCEKLDQKPGSSMNEGVVLETVRQLPLDESLSEQANHPVIKTGDQENLALTNKLNLQEAHVTRNTRHNFFSAPAKKDSDIPVTESSESYNIQKN